MQKSSSARAHLSRTFSGTMTNPVLKDIACFRSASPPRSRSPSPERHDNVSPSASRSVSPLLRVDPGMHRMNKTVSKTLRAISQKEHDMVQNDAVQKSIKVFQHIGGKRRPTVDAATLMKYIVILIFFFYVTSLE